MWTQLAPPKLVHYREGVLWLGVYYTLYWGFSECPLQRDEGCPLRGVPLYSTYQKQLYVLQVFLLRKLALSYYTCKQSALYGATAAYPVKFSYVTNLNHQCMQCKSCASKYCNSVVCDDKNMFVMLLVTVSKTFCLYQSANCAHKVYSISVLLSLQLSLF